MRTNLVRGFKPEPVCRVLTLRMESALRAMSRDDLHQEPRGFTADGITFWNSHTIGWLAHGRRQYCVIRDRSVSITRAGRTALQRAWEIDGA